MVNRWPLAFAPKPSTFSSRPPGTQQRTNSAGLNGSFAATIGSALNVQVGVDTSKRTAY